ncbi:type IV secretion system protein [Pseudomonas sp. LPH60]|uniref:type IV secretion system protein n=1 Tax=Pseudomonas sp. LPH60 TaxID=3065906 RepID=UPI00273B0434|nr:type IV secretion system protein [Pseudomonas sp. LPH60]MDP4573447.1 type IV secretion system protein [Pseudomonas sp. LPH60]
MAGPVVFQFIGEFLETALSPFIDGTVSEVISIFLPVFIGMGAIHLTVMGYAIGWGYVELPFSNFMKTCTKYLIIGGLALSASTYSNWIVGSIQGLESGFTQAFAATNSSGQQLTIYQTVDEALGKGWGLGADLWEQAANRGTMEVGMAIGEYFNALIIIAATCLLGLPAGAMIIVAKAALTLMLGIGPFFLALLIWPATAKFFDSWFGQCMTYAIRIALMAAVLGMAFKGFEGVINAVNLDSEQNPLFTSLVLIAFTYVMFMLLQEANGVAGSLAGGANSAAVTLRGMATSAAAPFRKAANTINATSTRRDMQSGMMTTAGRLNHLVAGNTMWNPAYRQNVMQNLGKNWGRASGGSVKQ